MVYASCHSYMDEGEAITEFIYNDNSKRKTSTRPFATAFARPSDFRFEFRDRYREDSEWKHYIVWQSGESVLTWWSIQPGVEAQPNLMLAIAGATGVSSGSAIAISNLLMPDTIQCNGILSLTDLEIMGKETIGDAPTYKIQGNRRWQGREDKSHQSKLTIWIDIQTLLILQTFTTRQHEDFETETTTTYRPQINVIVPSDKLAFNPPA